MKNRTYVGISLGLLGTAGVMQLVARRVPGFGQWYAVTIYPVIVGTLGRICGVFPFSVVEIGIYLLIIGALVYGVRHIGAPPKLLTGALVLISVLAFLYTTNCGVNYYRRPFSSYLNLDIGGSSEEELLRLCEYLTEKVNETAEEVAYESSWNAQARGAMSTLGETYPQLSGFYPRPKPLLISWVLSVQQLSGIYLPFTVEANYNCDMTAYNIPHTICHELSHLKGFMREDEANFIGYLACVESENRAFRYSGYLVGWIYATNELAKQNPEAYGELYGQLDQKVVADLKENSVFWNQYKGKVAEVSNQMNDTYLKMNDQADGVKSYGRMVDLMLAYYKVQW